MAYYSYSFNRPQPKPQRQEYATKEEFSELIQKVRTNGDNIQRVYTGVAKVKKEIDKTQGDVDNIRAEQAWMLNEIFGNDGIRSNLEDLRIKVGQLERRAPAPMKRLRVTVRASNNVVRIRK